MIYTVTSLILEDIYSMLPRIQTIIGEELNIMMKALEFADVSKMIDSRKRTKKLFSFL